MFKFEVPENDQSVYEITTESGNHYLIRCPGERSYETDGTIRDALFAFRVINGNEHLVQLRNLDLIVSAIRRPNLPIGKLRPRRMGDLFWTRPGEGAYGFQYFELK